MGSQLLDILARLSSNFTFNAISLVRRAQLLSDTAYQCRWRCKSDGVIVLGRKFILWMIITTQLIFFSPAELLRFLSVLYFCFWSKSNIFFRAIAPNILDLTAVLISTYFSPNKHNLMVENYYCRCVHDENTKKVNQNVFSHSFYFSVAHFELRLE